MLEFDWGRKDMAETTDFSITLSATEYQHVCDAFRYMKKYFESPSVVDKATTMLTKDDLANIIAFLEQFPPSQESIQIPMNFHNWTSYSGFILLAEDTLPAGNPANATIEKLNEKNYDLDEDGIAPRGP